MTRFTISAAIERWPIDGAFVIARGAKREAVVVTATVSDGHGMGRGECVPYARYGETVEGVRDAIIGLGAVRNRYELQQRIGAGAARNAIDCALWDYEAKSTGRSVAEIAGLAAPGPLTTAYTISLGTAEEMARQAAEAAKRLPLLKIKLGGEGDVGRMRAVRAACPGARLIADANEGWAGDRLGALMAVAAECGFEVIEQPLPADQDAALAGIVRPVPVCADESLHTRSDLQALADRYDAVNIKLDKTGGLTEALAVMAEARTIGFKIMVGCMVSTSLAMAPAVLLAQTADWVDLDGPLLLAQDRVPGLRYDGALVHPATPELWG
jgi:L-alanine-DL-glutamate epimerase-like enolase superfamily enzyme